MLRAAEHTGAGQYAEAEALYLALLKDDPDNFRVYQLLGNLAIAQGQFGDAVIMLNRAANLEPGDATVWLDLGRVQAELQKYDAAIDSTVKARDLNKEAVLPHLLIAAYQTALRHYYPKQAPAKSLVSVMTQAEWRTSCFLRWEFSETTTTKNMSTIVGIRRMA